MLLPELRGGT